MSERIGWLVAFIVWIAVFRQHLQQMKRIEEMLTRILTLMNARRDEEMKS